MAVSRNVIEFLLRADTSGLTGPLTKAKGDLEGLGTAAAKAGKETGAGLDALQSKLSSTANKMMGVGAAMTVATLPLAAALKSGLNALIEGERKAAQTAAVIKSTGGAANVSADDIKKMSGSLRDMSGVSAGTIREGQNMLLTFTKIRNQVGAGNDIFNQASKAILNMSVAMGTDMKTAAIQVGKALNDPIKGLTALNRVGIQFSAQQREQIEGFVKMGDVASAQKVILKELETQFGGSAEAFGNTAAGQAAKLENELLKLKMTLAEQLLPAFKVVVEQVSKLTSWFNSLDEGTKAWVATAAVALVAGGPILTGLGALTKLLSGLVGLYQKVAASATTAAAAQSSAAAAGAGTAGQLALPGMGGAAALGMSSTAIKVGGGALLGGAAFSTVQSMPSLESLDELDRAVAATSDLAEKQRLLREAVDQSDNGYRQFVDSVAEANGMTIEWGQTGSAVWGDQKDVIVGFATDTNTSISGVFQSISNLGGQLSNVAPALAQAAAQQQVQAAADAAGISLMGLNTALETMFQPYLQSEQAALQYKTALEQVDQATKNKQTTELQAQQSMLGLISASGAQVQSMAENGATQQQLSQVQVDAAAKLDALAEKYPALRGKADEYKTKIDELIAQSKTPITNKVNVETDEATRKLNDYKRLAASIQDNILTQHVPVPAAPEGARGGIIQGDVAYFARGGLFNQATAIVGEGNAPEYVIPTDRKYRGRALGLWQQAGAALMAEGGTVGGDGASLAGPLPGGDGGATLGVLGQIRDLLAQIAGAAAAAPAAVAAPTAAPAGGPAGPGGGADAAGGTDALTAATTAYGAAAAAATVVSQGLDAALVVSATATLPTLTAATQLGDQTTQAATASTAAQIPVQAQWQTTLAASKVGVDMLTAAVAQLIGQMQGLNATQVVLHIDHSQVATAAGSIGGLASAVQGALSSMGLTTNALSQWLGVVLALPSGVLAGAVGAESGGVVGKANVGEGFATSRPTLVGEGNPHWREFVVPTDPAHRGNAMKLLGALHEDLGVPKLAAGGVVGQDSIQTPWGGTAASAPGALGKVAAGSLMAVAALAANTGGSASGDDYHAIENYLEQTHQPYIEVSTVRPGARTHATGALSYHATGDAVDLGGDLYAIWADLDKLGGAGEGGVLQELIYAGAPTYIGGGTRKPIGQLNRITYNDHHDHVHAAIPRDTTVNGGTGAKIDLPEGWQQVGQYILDRFRAAGIGVPASGGPTGGGIDGGIPAGAQQWHGKISEFGGPGDFQGTAYDGNTRDLYNQGFPFAAMRERDMANRWVGISTGGASTKAQILDYGPATWTGRVIDVSPTVMSALGASTDDWVDVWALEKGGIIPAGKYDAGGYLPEGLSLAYNGTGRPEPVGHHLEQPTVVVNVTVEGSVMAENDLATSIGDKIRANIRRGYIWKIN